jgi:RNA recognition motif. (a.k.a. RRM, RBD, or RNP domain)
MSYDYAAALTTFNESRRQAWALDEHPHVDDDELSSHDHKRGAVLQRAVDTMAQLSVSCPLTPLLWIQYAATLSDWYSSIFSQNDPENGQPLQQQGGYELERDTLQLGLVEFPGSALLQVRAVVVQILILLLSSPYEKEQTTPLEKPTTTLLSDIVATCRAALASLGSGGTVHRNEDYLLVVLYRLWAVAAATAVTLTDSDNDDEERLVWRDSLQECWVRRSRCPMRHANETLLAELQTQMATLQTQMATLRAETTTSMNRGAADGTTDTDWQSSLVERIEQERAWEAQHYGPYARYEDAWDGALQADGVLVARTQSEFQGPTVLNDLNDDNWMARLRACWSHLDWNAILKSTNPSSYGMGLGGNATARAVVTYVRALPRTVANPDVTSTDENQVTDELGTVTVQPSETMAQQWKMDLYERGVADCPCVEYLWLSYLRDLQTWSRTNGAAARRYASVAARAVRNCPFSVSLLQQQVVTVLHLATIDNSTNGAQQESLVVVDPDQLLDLVQKGLDLQFLPREPHVELDLYLTAIGVVKRRILGLLAASLPKRATLKKSNHRSAAVYFDDGEPFHTAKSKTTPSVANSRKAELDAEARQEVSDLLEDITDMYDEVERRLRQIAPGETERLAHLAWERAQTQALLLHPLRQALNDAHSGTNGIKAEIIGNDDIDDASIVQSLQLYEKCIRTHNPPHPHAYSAYIRQYMAALTFVPAHSPVQVMVRLRRVRGLFEKALTFLGRGARGSQSAQAPSSSRWHLDYDAALHSICHEWLEFERVFGSERSVGKATKAIEKKLQKSGRRGRESSPQQPPLPPLQSAGELTDSLVPTSDAVPAPSQPLPNSPICDFPPPSKKAKTDETDSVQDDPPLTSAAAKPAEMKYKNTTDKEPSPSTAPAKKRPVPKVRSGKMEYPAHPFTVRVSNLSLSTEDMDLVDTFRPKCGAIVHAKIVRDKHKHGHHYPPPSLGWGLIQFERIESVETALALDDTLGIHEQLVKVDRSHVPAVGLVPPGMHRVCPQGEGKVSKRNLKRKERSTSETSSTVPVTASGTIVAPENPRQEATVINPLSREPVQQPVKSTKPGAGLAFRPRNLVRASQKARLQLDQPNQHSVEKQRDNVK